MEARLSCAAIVAAALLSCGANFRSQNFIVHSGSSDAIAAELCTAAETYRRDLAIQWLGQELPPWPQPCPIDASRVAPHEGAGGKTSFFFREGQPFGWEMEVYGTRERVLDSVLPHEVTHTIFATHFGQPLPRWADEGACTTVEHASEKAKQDANLIRFLKTDRGIAFNRMFAMKEYPRDMLPLYSQGYSLARFLILRGGDEGRRKFIAYVGDGLRQENWTKATREHYGFSSLSDLQVAWLDWVKTGSPEMKPAESGPPLASGGEPLAVKSGSASPASFTDEQPLAQTYQQPPRPSTFAHESTEPESGSLEHSSVARPTPEGWYARQRNRKPVPGNQVPTASERPREEELQPVRSAPPAERKLLMEWSRQREPITTSESSLATKWR